MDSRILLDYALFHLTPTRTRCDLVVFCGGKSEKLASGLVEPFVAHLKYAKDQILKGGYSITLRPPTPDAFWFTKDTFQRFVRFVSTPEILERFLRTEQEITQIEKSIEVNEISSSKIATREIEGSSLAADGISKTTSTSYKSKSDADGVASEENSKFRLQRVLDTRKALLLKEQAMAFARAKAAGFKIENMDDLTYFADSFGATRLREACVGFRDLYMLKCKDAQWMDEVAAMEAFPPNMFSYVGASGITLASDNDSPNHNENNGSSDILDADKATIADKGQAAPTAAEFQMKMPWANQVPHYMYNFHNSMQQVPPYPAYPFPGAHPVSPYYPEHVQWPIVDGRMNKFTRQSHKSKKKGKSKNDSRSEDGEHSESGSSDSGTESEKDEKGLLRKKKKPSKTVVIRNINYITSTRRNDDTDDTSSGSSSEENAEFDEDAIKQEVVDAVTSLKKHQHSGSHKKKSGRNRRSTIQNDNDGLSDHGIVKYSTVEIPEEGQKNQNWSAFQNILMSQEESNPSKAQDRTPVNVEDPLAIGTYNDDNSFARAPIVGFETEKVKVQHFEFDASVIATQRHGYNDVKPDVIDITNIEARRSSMRSCDSDDVQHIFSQKSKDSAISPWRMTSDPSADSPLIKNGNREDWFIVNQTGNLDIQEAKQMILDESNTFSSAKDSNLMEASKRVSIDDSFMVQSHQSLDGQHDSDWRTDIIIESDLSTAPPPETCSHKSLQPYHEPDDPCVMLARDSVVESSGSWTPEIDYGIETSSVEVVKRTSVETNTEQTPIVHSKSTNGKKVLKTSGKEATSRLLQGTISRGLVNGSHQAKKSSSTTRLANPKGKMEKEEETRRRMEELVLERQKRIAERSASNGVGAAASKKVLGRSKTTSSMMHETKRLSGKPVTSKS